MAISYLNCHIVYNPSEDSLQEDYSLEQNFDDFILPYPFWGKTEDSTPVLEKVVVAQYGCVQELKHSLMSEEEDLINEGRVFVKSLNL